MKYSCPCQHYSDLAKVMHDGIKESRLVPVENAGHGFYSEEKEKLNTELVNFIS